MLWFLLMTLILPTADDARRISEVVMRDESRPRNELDPNRRPVPDMIELHAVQITSIVQTSGRWPGTAYLFNASTGAYTALGSAGAVWVIVADTTTAADQGTLQTGRYYRAHAVGVHTDGKPVFAVIGETRKARCRVKRTSQLVLSGSHVSQFISWQAEDYDTDSMWDVGTPTAINVPFPGLWLAVGQVWTQVGNGTFSDGTVQINLGFAPGTWSVPGGQQNSFDSKSIVTTIIGVARGFNLSLMVHIPADAPSGVTLPTFFLGYEGWQAAVGSPTFTVDTPTSALTVSRIGP